jgi:hypothetical protein
VTERNIKTEWEMKFFLIFIQIIIKTHAFIRGAHKRGKQMYRKSKGRSAKARSGAQKQGWSSQANKMREGGVKIIKNATGAKIQN